MEFYFYLDILRLLPECSVEKYPIAPPKCGTMERNDSTARGRAAGNTTRTLTVFIIYRFRILIWTLTRILYLEEQRDVCDGKKTCIKWHE